VTNEEAINYIQNSIEPKLQELGKNYVLLLENTQYAMAYKGDLYELAYMLGQTLQDLLTLPEADKEVKEQIIQAFIHGYKEPFNDTVKGEW
jgi:hypothetical protein